MLQGAEQPEDNHFPEDWIMSVVSARNTGREHIRDEGLSKIETSQQDIYLKDLLEHNPIDFLGRSHIEKYSNHTGVLVKVIDAAERLTVQVHPDRVKAKELFNSSFGKTECWHILGGREVNGEMPHVYLGFKPGVTREQWTRLFEEQDINGMLDCLHKYEVKQGDTFLIEGGTPHAIGAGCLLVEIQEPTDYTIRIEKTSPSGLVIDDYMCHQGLGFEKMFECFHYHSYTREETLRKWKILSKIINESESSMEEVLIDYKDTPYFRMTVVEVEKELEITGNGVFSGLYIISGAADITAGSTNLSGTVGDQFFIPAKAAKYRIQNKGNEPFRALRLFGPKVS
ncbi:mannose-6-phosphate isomerase [Oceanobacillus piezotolerans]|uniref:Mannose-6-phosphate isomerase n=1 Tax=Oceanobacillus piezotolerans TaxID=2448030 RepID=A0A498DJ64_9BACI|nr:type I phosphomannose isomerase catalytic subunit [Oceanobacillus piezotolerans]RLL41806.1 mannose-6-phosphate isomerase [Oceanobacillus piezotolerans]